MPNSSAGGILKRTLRHSKYSTYTVIKSKALPWSFTFIVLGYKLCYPWIPRAVLLVEEPSSQRRNKKSLKIGDGPETRQSSTCCRDFETKEQESEGRGRTRHAAQTISKRQALYSGKVPVNADLRPEERETRNRDTAL